MYQPTACNHLSLTMVPADFPAFNDIKNSSVDSHSVCHSVTNNNDYCILRTHQQIIKLADTKAGGEVAKAQGILNWLVISLALLDNSNFSSDLDMIQTGYLSFLIITSTLTNENTIYTPTHLPPTTNFESRTERDP